MIRVRIEAHPSVEPSKVVITVRGLEQWVMVPRCVRLECLFFALDKQSNRGCVPFFGLFFFFSFFLSFNHSIFLKFFGVCVGVFQCRCILFICFVFYLIFQGQWNWGWFEASSEGKRALFDWVFSWWFSCVHLGFLLFCQFQARESLAHLLIIDHILVPSLPTNDIRIGTLKLCGAVFIIIIIIFPLLFQRIRFESGYYVKMNVSS